MSDHDGIKDIDKRYVPLLGGVKGLFGSDRYADFTIQCEERKWKVHKAIVCPQSEVLATALDGRFNAGNFARLRYGQDDKSIICLPDFWRREALEKTFTFVDTEPEAVNAMLRYFYSGDYDDTGHEVSINVPVFRLADQYLIEPLANLAAAKLRTHVAGAWQGPGLVEAINQVYLHEAGHFSAMREGLLEVSREHLVELLDDPSRYPDFHSAARASPEFLVDALASQKLVRHPEERNNPTRKRFKCPHRHSLCLKLDYIRLPCPAVTGPGNYMYCPGGTMFSWQDWMRHEVKDQ